MSSDKPQSIIGKLADLMDGQIVLPSFILARQDGIFIDLTRLETTQEFQMAIDKIFASDAYFLDIDYERFSKLLYSADPSEAGTIEKCSESQSMIRFARDVVAFLPARRKLYKAVKISAGKAEYLFEQVFLETATNNGEVSLVPTNLTFDEFVADMWLKGVRFGIDIDAVKNAINNGASGRIEIAQRLERIAGKDAEIKELAKEIHRDDAPKRLADGRVNLQQFKNRFPQIKNGAKLIMKIPMVMGINGYEISGVAHVPPIPKDIDLALLAGPGTAVEIGSQGEEIIVSQSEGFLNIDTRSNQISITDKIISLEGVSAKTTGDLILTGSEFEEHGEVQEKRLIEGQNITLHANVFGTISSRGGNILLNKNLVGGAAINRDGDITVNGLASSSFLQTANGTITMKRAESCVIVGTRVNIEFASNCEIVAEEVTITTAEGCAVVAKIIAIESAGQRKQSEMLMYMQVPDLADINQKIRGIKDKIDELLLTISNDSQKLDRVSIDPDYKKYTFIADKLKSGELKLTLEQATPMQKLATIVSPMLKLVAELNANIKKSLAEKNELEEDIRKLIKIKDDAESSVRCSVAMINDEILVKTIKGTPESEAALRRLEPQNLKSILRGGSMLGDCVFSGSVGSLEWKFIAPK